MKLSTKWSIRLLTLFVLVGLTASLMACAANAPASTISDAAGSEANNVPNLPTDTPESTSTPVPTATLAPTNTPTAIPTETPTATPEPTQTPTVTPKPTQTPTATPVDTPEPTLTPKPTSPPQATAVPQPSQPTVAPTAEAEAEESFVTIYYISNPNDILGNFPEKPFNADELRSHMVNIQSSLNRMQSNLDAAKAGDAAACSSYVSAYNNILYSGTFYKDVPSDWQEIDFIYFISFVYSLDRTRPAYLACVNGGDMGDFNYGLAYSAIGETLNILNPAIVSAYAK
ncbi:MAG: hypothetical protein KBE23_05360 [Chloroflexi bacterium]|nr:hypothetical protein [Chloroflexota bacterium]MBP7042148.1 hypothetical protein [Chloroflexota bacterium]